MTIDNQGKAIEYLYRALPCSHLIKDIDLSHEPAIYFTWRSGRYKLEISTGSVDKVDGSMLIGDDCSMLIRELVLHQMKLDIFNQTKP
jgi:hypothetical protein